VSEQKPAPVPKPVQIQGVDHFRHILGRSTFSQPASATSGIAGYDLEGSPKKPHPGSKPIR
jgi:hypothetical protein